MGVLLCSHVNCFCLLVCCAPRLAVQSCDLMRHNPDLDHLDHLDYQTSSFCCVFRRMCWLMCGEVLFTECPGYLHNTHCGSACVAGPVHITLPVCFIQCTILQTDSFLSAHDRVHTLRVSYLVWPVAACSQSTAAPIKSSSSVSQQSTMITACSAGTRNQADWGLLHCYALTHTHTGRLCILEHNATQHNMTTVHRSCCCCIRQ